MRLYGELGLRLSADDVPAGDETTSEEHAENYFAVVALEPELLSDVWRDAGNGSQRLSLVRKARGDEAHKGGSIFVAGQPGDRCIQSWLSGEVDSALCEVAAELPTSPFAP